jgi:hypothetical protein
MDEFVPKKAVVTHDIAVLSCLLHLKTNTILNFLSCMLCVSVEYAILCYF